MVYTRRIGKCDEGITALLYTKLPPATRPCARAEGGWRALTIGAQITGTIRHLKHARLTNRGSGVLVSYFRGEVLSPSGQWRSLILFLAASVILREFEE